MICFVGVINKTADIEIIHTYKPSPPTTVRDYVNPKVGDKLYDSENRFIQEWLTGMYCKQVRLPLIYKKNIYW